ncbi:MAG: NADP-dependent malic enzyme [Firmicutes bacterium]|nr:NADP-dependent malic enzyme [Bacillota bacterium]
MPDNVEKLLAKAAKPSEDAMNMHPFYKGKIQVMPKCPVRSFDDFAIWYSPGVAAPCKAIAANPETVMEHTNKGNLVAVVSDGTRVLGLGDIGAEAAMPVMEGKALLFKYLGGVDAFPICLKTKDPDELIRVCRMLEGTFGGINLEDIAQPKCFRILDTLRKEAEIPVWHDDQQGTAAVTLAGLINALKIVDKKLRDVKIAMIGAGAANIAISRLLFHAGVNPENAIMVDINGILHKDREDLINECEEKRKICLTTNRDNVRGGIPEAMKGADVVIALSKPGPDTIEKEWIRTMAPKAVVFTCANPVPEIWPWEAKEAGAAIVATGRSDFPNQVNNSIGFPGIFRGTLDVMASTITDEMCIAAAEALAEIAEAKGMHEDHILPSMDEWEIYPGVAVATGMKAVEQGVAKLKLSKDQLFEKSSAIINNARESAKLLMESGLIPPYEEK